MKKSSFLFFLFWMFNCSTVFTEVSKPFVIGDLTLGQLGNQYFIIAATASLALDHDAIPLFPDLKTAREHNVPLNYQKIFSQLEAKRPPSKVEYLYEEPGFNYNKIPYQPNMKIKGYFQSEKYFIHHKDEILRLFAPSKEITDYLHETYRDIIENPRTVSIHYRSYAKEDPKHQVYAECSLNYFAAAISLFPSDSLFVVFSNDLEWCKHHFKWLGKKFYYVEDEPYYHDLYLMSICKDNIICNSTFSWWGAYLNLNPHKIVVAPHQWFNPCYISNPQDLIPEDWIQLDEHLGYF